MLRSHTPEGVRQNSTRCLWCISIRALMIALPSGGPGPDRLSFTEAVFQISEAITDERGEAELPPAMQRWRTERLLQRLRRTLLPERRLRINRREVKQILKN